MAVDEAVTALDTTTSWAVTTVTSTVVASSLVLSAEGPDLARVEQAVLFDVAAHPLGGGHAEDETLTAAPAEGVSPPGWSAVLEGGHPAGVDEADVAVSVTAAAGRITPTWSWSVPVVSTAAGVLAVASTVVVEVSSSIRVQA